MKAWESRRDGGVGGGWRKNESEGSSSFLFGFLYHVTGINSLVHTHTHTLADACVCVCTVCVAQYQCPEDSQCVDYYKVCDQHPDCPEASDEMNCTDGKTLKSVLM